MSQPVNPTQYVTVKIYDQTYHLSGQNPEQIQHMASLVDAKMRAVAAHGRTVDSLRVAVLAALNLADELARAQSRPPAAAATAKQARNTQGRARAANLSGLLDEVLGERKTGT